MELLSLTILLSVYTGALWMLGRHYGEKGMKNRQKDLLSAYNKIQMDAATRQGTPRAQEIAHARLEGALDAISAMYNYLDGQTEITEPDD